MSTTRLTLVLGCDELVRVIHQYNGNDSMSERHNPPEPLPIPNREQPGELAQAETQGYVEPYTGLDGAVK